MQHIKLHLKFAAGLMSEEHVYLTKAWVFFDIKVDLFISVGLQQPRSPVRVNDLTDTNSI